MSEKAAYRQKALEKAKAFQGPETAPPCKLIREPDNPYDPGAVKVYLGVDYTKSTNQWEYVHVGYMPRDLKIPLRSAKGDLITAPPGNDPSTYLLWKAMDALATGKAPGKLLVGVDFIAKAPGTTSYGCQIGLRHDVAKS